MRCLDRIFILRLWFTIFEKHQTPLKSRNSDKNFDADNFYFAKMKWASGVPDLTQNAPYVNFFCLYIEFLKIYIY